MSEIKGIDLSDYQRGLAIASLRSQGVKFLILKVGEGSTLTDASFDAFYNEARATASRSARIFTATQWRRKRRCGKQAIKCLCPYRRWSGGYWNAQIQRNFRTLLIRRQ